MAVRKKRAVIRRAGMYLAGFLLVLMGMTAAQVLTFRFLNPPVTINMLWEKTRHVLWNAPYARHQYDWRDLSDISQHLQRAVLAAEDQRFLTHNGIDLQELKIVIRDVMNNTGKPRGVSTITMQAARSLFLPATRNPLRKVAELWYTLLMELFWSKARILEIYLNTVDWGSGIVGAEAGAQRYFKTRASDLNPNQAALMAAILPSPHRWSPVDPSPYIRKRQKWILRYMPAMPTVPVSAADRLRNQLISMISTSKIRVALGGITPGYPVSPYPRG